MADVVDTVAVAGANTDSLYREASFYQELAIPVMIAERFFAELVALGLMKPSIANKCMQNPYWRQAILTIPFKMQEIVDKNPSYLPGMLSGVYEVKITNEGEKLEMVKCQKIERFKTDKIKVMEICEECGLKSKGECPIIPPHESIRDVNYESQVFNFHEIRIDSSWVLKNLKELVHAFLDVFNTEYPIVSYAEYKALYSIKTEFELLSRRINEGLDERYLRMIGVEAEVRKEFDEGNGKRDEMVEEQDKIDESQNKDEPSTKEEEEEEEPERIKDTVDYKVLKALEEMI